MHLSRLDKTKLKTRLLLLMDAVNLHLNDEPDVDKFLDETTLFDEWEAALSEEEYPIFIMAVLNNIRRESILNSIVSSILEERIVEDSSFENSKPKLAQSRSHVGEHPFN